MANGNTKTQNRKKASPGGEALEGNHPSGLHEELADKGGKGSLPHEVTGRPFSKEL